MRFRGALRGLCFSLPGSENVLTALTIINRAGHGIRVRKALASQVLVLTPPSGRTFKEIENEYCDC